MHENGEGTTQNLKTALELFKSVADQHEQAKQHFEQLFKLDDLESSTNDIGNALFTFHINDEFGSQIEAFPIELWRLISSYLDVDTLKNIRLAFCGSRNRNNVSQDLFNSSAEQLANDCFITWRSTKPHKQIPLDRMCSAFPSFSQLRLARCTKSQIQNLISQIDQTGTASNPNLHTKFIELIDPRIPILENP